jgi:prephenate dehydrogenase
VPGIVNVRGIVYACRFTPSVLTNTPLTADASVAVTVIVAVPIHDSPQISQSIVTLTSGGIVSHTGSTGEQIRLPV